MVSQQEILLQTIGQVFDIENPDLLEIIKSNEILPMEELLKLWEARPLAKAGDVLSFSTAQRDALASLYVFLFKTEPFPYLYESYLYADYDSHLLENFHDSIVKKYPKCEAYIQAVQERLKTHQSSPPEEVSQIEFEDWCEGIKNCCYFLRKSTNTPAPLKVLGH
jgi:hypothetical protein